MPRKGRRHDHRSDSRDVENQERLHATRHARHRSSGHDNAGHIDNSEIATHNPIRRRYAEREGKLHDRDRRHGEREEGVRRNGRTPRADNAGGGGSLGFDWDVQLPTHLLNCASPQPITVADISMTFKTIRKTAFAVYSDTDKSLDFYKRIRIPQAGGNAERENRH